MSAADVAFGLIIASGIIHAFVNPILKSGRDKMEPRCSGPIRPPDQAGAKAEMAVARSARRKGFSRRARSGATPSTSA